MQAAANAMLPGRYRPKPADPEIVPGWCMNVVAAARASHAVRSAVATMVVLLLPFLFLYLMKRVTAAKRQ